MYPSSVVQTGVKSLGCENRQAQESPIHSWNLIVPCVVLAVKSGATSLIRSDMVLLYRARDSRRPAVPGFRLARIATNAYRGFVVMSRRATRSSDRPRGLRRLTFVDGRWSGRHRRERDRRTFRSGRAAGV